MPPPSEPKGLPELRDVVGRLAKRAGLGMSPEHLNQVADHIYHGKSQGPFPQNSPFLHHENWTKLARVGDPRAEQPHDVDWLFNTPKKRIPQWREQMRRGEVGPGWTPEDRAEQGEPEKFKLSPGDQQNHAWMRDREYLEAMASRDRSLDSAAEKDAELKSVMQYFAPNPGMGAARRPIEDALHYYNRGENATHAYSPGANGVWATANFKQHSTPQAEFDALYNPEFAAGWLGAASSPLSHFMHSMTAKDPTAAEPEWVTNSRNSNVLGHLAATGYDFARNLGESLLKPSELADQLGASAGQLDNQWSRAISPVLTEPAETADERHKAVGGALADASDSQQGMGFDDYHRAKTGKVPSWVGSNVASALSDAPFDPLTLLTAPFGGYGSEFVEEGLTSLPLTFGASAAFSPAIPSPGQMMKQGIENRPDLEGSYLPDDQFKEQMGGYDANMKETNDRLRQRRNYKAHTSPTKKTPASDLHPLLRDQTGLGPM